MKVLTARLVYGEVKENVVTAEVALYTDSHRAFIVFHESIFTYRE